MSLFVSLIWFTFIYDGWSLTTAISRRPDGGLSPVIVEVPKKLNSSYLRPALEPLPPQSSRFASQQSHGWLEGQWQHLVSFLRPAATQAAKNAKDEKLFAGCQSLIQTQPGLGKLKVMNGAFVFDKEPLEPVYLFYRFTGHSRHDKLAEHTPALGAVSLLNALQATSKILRKSMHVYVLLNGEDRESYVDWFRGKLRELELESFDVRDVPEGNDKSYSEMISSAQKVKDVDRAMLLFLEEDYLVHPDMLIKLVDFWTAYDPCALVPYDYPDRYTRTDNQGYHAEAILHAPGLHWRTVESATVTFAMRLDVFRALESKQLIPAPWDDRGPSRQVNRLVGLWAPMPSLASHIHHDCTGPCTLTDPNFDYPAYEKLLLEKARCMRMPFIG